MVEWQGTGHKELVYWRWAALSWLGDGSVSSLPGALIFMVKLEVWRAQCSDETREASFHNLLYSYLGNNNLLSQRVGRSVATPQRKGHTTDPRVWCGKPHGGGGGGAGRGVPRSLQGDHYPGLTTSPRAKKDTAWGQLLHGLCCLVDPREIWSWLASHWSFDGVSVIQRPFLWASDFSPITWGQVLV